MIDRITEKSRFGFVAKEMVGTYLKKHVERGAAALSYHLTLSVFPLLIVVSAILGRLQIGESPLFEAVENVVPLAALAVITDFLGHAGGIRSELVFTVGIMAMITSSSAVFRSFTGIMGDIQGKARFKGIWKGIFSFIFSVVFLASIYVSGLVILSGEWLMQILEVHFHFGDILASWKWIRFVVLFLILFCMIFVMYVVSAPKETKKTYRFPGAILATVVLVAASMLFSRMISVSIKYTVVYGSLASIIIMMVWLYTCGTILIMGNVFNISLRNMKEKFG